MSPTVLLLLSVLTVQGSGCDDFMKTTVRNLQDSIDSERTDGFPQVFPKNYIVSHHFNASLLCNEPCCVFSTAVFLSNSWIHLVQHLSRVHLKHRFINELIITLDNIAKKKIPEVPDLTGFPSYQSSPEGLLSFTSLLFTRWLNLDCAFGEDSCIFPTPSEEEPGDQAFVEKESVKVEEKPEPVIERISEKIHQTNGFVTSQSSCLSCWTIPFLWITSSVL
ncbi:hypothetical protein DNTS_017880 [Danionella cerebrum]|uniref:Uncharacterized protein n=1 Tax=Danionella cerebrum TaxID=2873325 RepID=A0A553N229_9TELE|nr:hypothetical protein DNTS_017880 [Danionella translucida]